MEKQRIVIFDMDGTLIDSSIDITITINHIRRRKGLDPVDALSVIQAINSGKENLAELFYGTKSYEKPDKELFETHYWDQCIQNIRVYPQVEETLEQLKEQGCRLAVATNAASIFAKKMLKTTGLNRYFEHILGSCDVKHSKPHPEIIHKIMQRYRFDTRSFHVPVLVGDSHKDLGAAKEAKIHAIYARWGFENDDVKEALNAHAPNEVPGLLERL